jgi:sigma-B regulation protein RsbU (phosphoserine phosphatase)
VQYAVFDPRTQEIQIASAGMPGPFHLSARGSQVLEIQGIPPGLFDPAVTYETVKITLEPGDSVLFLTDGIPDAFDIEGESFGTDRLQAICETSTHGSPAGLLGQIFSAVEQFARGRTQHDDMAAAIFHYSHG